MLYLSLKFNIIKGFKIEDTLSNKIEVIKDNKIIKGGLKGDNK